MIANPDSTDQKISELEEHMESANHEMTHMVIWISILFIVSIMIGFGVILYLQKKQQQTSQNLMQSIVSGSQQNLPLGQSSSYNTSQALDTENIRNNAIQDHRTNVQMGKNEFDAEQFTELDEKNFETSRGLKTNTVKDQKEHDTKI